MGLQSSFCSWNKLVQWRSSTIMHFNHKVLKFGTHILHYLAKIFGYRAKLKAPPGGWWAHLNKHADFGRF